MFSTGNARNSLSQKSVWLVIFLTTVICVMPVLTYRFLKVDLSPTLSDKVMQQKCVLQKSDLHFLRQHNLQSYAVVTDALLKLFRLGFPSHVHQSAIMLWSSKVKMKEIKLGWLEDWFRATPKLQFLYHVPTL